MANTVEPGTDGDSSVEEMLLSRWRFLELCVASTVGLGLLSLAGCGGQEDGEEDNDEDEENGGGGNGNGEEDNGDGGGY